MSDLQKEIYKMLAFIDSDIAPALNKKFLALDIKAACIGMDKLRDNATTGKYN